MWLVVSLAVLGEQLDAIILEVFSNWNDSVIHAETGRERQKEAPASAEALEHPDLELWGG